MLGVVPVGAAVGPTLLHDAFVPPWNRMLALVSSARVGGVLGSSCAIRFSTAGVYGAFDATAGELAVAGSCTGSAYGTSDGVLGCTQPAGVAAVPAPPSAVAACAAAAGIIVRHTAAVPPSTSALRHRRPEGHPTIPIMNCPLSIEGSEKCANLLLAPLTKSKA